MLGFDVWKSDPFAEIHALTNSTSLFSEQAPQSLKNPATKKASPTKKHKIAKPFTEKSRNSFGDRFNSLGEKWQLKSGTIVENVLYIAGLQVETYSPIHSFMLDLDDQDTKKLFSLEDWDEITSELPTQAQYEEVAYDYLEKFSTAN
ncbi:hypothetical protein BGZ76_005950 [Entomortierella beljakovae]|nr:hypothetical protein BGZ76_005950 [Entomortierella beljakovae]